MTRSFIFLAALAASTTFPQAAFAQDAGAPTPVAADTPAAAAAMANPDVVTVRNVTRGELTPGLVILEDGGATVGTVARLAGNDVILNGAHKGRMVEYRVPITQLFAYSQDGVDRYASRTPRSALKADTGASMAVNGGQ